MSPESSRQPAPEAVGDTVFAQSLARALRGRRESLGWTLERMVRQAHDEERPGIDATMLEELESGLMNEGHRGLIKDVADTYDLDLARVGGARVPVQIDPDAFVIDDVRVPWYSDHTDDVLVAFLETIRRVRRQPEVEVSGFRRIDIEAIASHFRLTAAFVLERLGELIGATDTRVAAMSSMYTSGGQVIPTGIDEYASQVTGPPSRLVELLSSADSGS